MKTRQPGPWWVALSLLAAVSFAARAALPYPPQVDLETVRQAVASTPRSHPRLFATADQLRALRHGFPAGSIKQRVAEVIVRKARALERQKPVERVLEGLRLLGQSRRCLERVLLLATAWHLTGDERFVRRAEREMLAAAAFTDWNPNHFLDVAEMAFGLAVGYDWLYDQLRPEAREAIRQALRDKALRLPFETRHRGWVRAGNNWGQVCHGGLTTAALAILEDEPELAARTILNALQNVTVSMGAYAPKGSYPEGPGYWSYGTTYNVLLIAALESVLGTDYGLSGAPGFDQTGAYPVLVTGPSGYTFNYADGGAGRGPEPAVFWFAKRFQRPDWLWLEYDLLREKTDAAGRFLPMVLFWMDENEKPPRQCHLPLHWSSEGPVPITLHRSSWTDPHQVFLGFKGGSPSANHGQMDIGSFVLDADGVRWAMDLGAEGYHRIESRGMSLWNRNQDSDRWKIFRQMNHGHNTLVIDDQLQRAAGFGRFTAFSDDPAFPHSVLDMSDVYRDQARSVRRGVALLPTRQVLFRDELEGLKPGARVRWGMITPGRPGQTGGRTMRLTQGRARLELTILAPEGAVWETYDTAKPRNEWDSPNPGTVMVQFHGVAPADGRLELVVLARPGTAATAEVDPALPRRPLAEWK